MWPSFVSEVLRAKQIEREVLAQSERRVIVGMQDPDCGQVLGQVLDRQRIDDPKRHNAGRDQH